MARVKQVNSMCLGILMVVQAGVFTSKLYPATAIRLLAENNTCVAGDSGYCNNRGVCIGNGTGCECYDYLHYWPSERCADWHDGRELGAGQICYPQTTDSYCHWLGVCNENGTACECFSPDHFWTSENCSTWHEAKQHNQNQSCAPNTTDSFCHWLGTCNDEGNGCNCYDEHFWVSENCAEWHESPQPGVGQKCYPGSVNSYCSWLGECNSNGTGCECFDPHFHSSENCASYHQEVELEAGQHCSPNVTDGHCNWLGHCNSDGSACECFDPTHFWASENCSTYHDRPQLQDGQCCSPGRRDPYCSWMGVCNGNATACECDDPDHYLPAERCKIYHQNISNANPPQLEDGQCPPVDPEDGDNSGTTNNNKSDGVKHDGNHYPYGWPYWTAIIAAGLVVASAFLIHRARKHNHRNHVPTHVSRGAPAGTDARSAQRPDYAV